MILTRAGNKRRIAKNIIKHFPSHQTYLEPFFGAGGLFFNKERSQYNIMNDQDSDVYNLFTVISNRMADLEDFVIKVPISEDLFKFWFKNKEKDLIRKAARFLFLSNFSFLGQMNTFSFNNKNKMQLLYNRIAETNKLLFGVEFANCDFRRFLDRIPNRGNETNKWFIYNDPPYLETGNTYEGHWTIKDSHELFQTMIDTGCRFAISEFDNPKIIEIANKYDLNITEIGERQNLKNRRIEILIKNY